MQRRTFRYYGIEFVAEGRGELQLSGRTSPLLTGSLFSYGRDTLHRITTSRESPMTKYFVDFTGRGADKLVRATSLARGPIQAAEPARLRAMFDELHRSADDAGPRAADLAILLLRAILLTADALALRADAAKSRSADSFEQCKLCIDEHFQEFNGLADVAAACHMDAATICRLFKRYGDSSPYQYLLRRKMNHAAERLQASPVMIKQLASDMGFSDPFHFSRAFKRVHGLSPHQFRTLAARAALPS